MSNTVPVVNPPQPLPDLRQESVTKLHALLPETVEALRRNLNCGQPEVEVMAAQTILDIALAPETAYSFKGHISNRTNHTLVFKEKETNGNWKTEPPKTIGPGGTGEMTLDYDGFGFNGKVIYTAEGVTGEFTMKWNIPLFGNNSIEDATTISGTSATHEGGRGWHAEVWYYLASA